MGIYHVPGILQSTVCALFHLIPTSLWGSQFVFLILQTRQLNIERSPFRANKWFISTLAGSKTGLLTAMQVELRYNSVPELSRVPTALPVLKLSTQGTSQSWHKAGSSGLFHALQKLAQMRKQKSFPCTPSPMPNVHLRLYFLEASFLSWCQKGKKKLTNVAFALELLVLNPGEHG